MVTILDILADSHCEGLVTIRKRQRSWELQVQAFPKGVALHLRRRCEVCKGPKRRKQPQFWVRWVDPTRGNWEDAHMACSFSCAIKMRVRLTPGRA